MDRPLTQSGSAAEPGWQESDQASKPPNFQASSPLFQASKHPSVLWYTTRVSMTENRRIALNIAATYGRSLFALACGLFTGRWVLLSLGQVDYGL